jgi:hypothetical protein
MKEIWKWVPGFEERYQVSSEGHLRSYLSGECRLLAPCPDPRGYIPVFLRGKQNRRYWLHRLIAEVFIPNPKLRREVNHKNGIKSDCRVINLEWVSRSQNIRHAYENALIKHVGQRGEASHRTTLTNEQVIEIRKKYEEREITQNELAELFHVSSPTIYRIIHRLSWSHI